MYAVSEVGGATAESAQGAPRRDVSRARAARAGGASVPPGSGGGRGADLGWFAPRLVASADTVVVRARRLPLPGEVLVRQGQAVRPDDIVARASLPGRALPLAIAGLLGCEPGEAARFLRVTEGEPVKRGQMLARYPGVLGLGRRTVHAPEDALVERFSAQSGHMVLRALPQSLYLQAHLPGTVSRVWPGQGCEVRCRAMHVQGVYGTGGEARGRLAVPDAAFAAGAETLEGAVCVAVAADAVGLTRWIEAGAVAAVVGGIPYTDITALAVRYPRFTVVMTEGFGRLRMAEPTFGLLQRHAGAQACVDGTTQIRAGVIRPEVVVPLPAGGTAAAERLAAGARPGRQLRVRIIRDPGFGRTGDLLQLPAEPRVVGSEASVLVAVIRLDGGGVVAVPRPNMEPVG